MAGERTGRERLEWKGPFELADGLDPQGAHRLPAEPGVYLWTLPSGGQYLVHYIGSAADVRARQRRHAHGQLSGEYFLPHFDGDRFDEWQPPAQGLTSDEELYRRTALFVSEGQWVQRARLYLTAVRIFVARTERYHDVERTLQVRFREYFAAGEREAASVRGCPPVSLRGSRAFSGDPLWMEHVTEERIPGISDWDRWRGGS